MSTEPSAQTQLLQKDIEHLGANLRVMDSNITARFQHVADEQMHQWQEIKENTTTTNQLKLDVNIALAKVTTKVAFFSFLGSSIASAVAIFVVMQILNQ